MKHLKLNLEGKELKLAFTLGAIEDFCEETETDFSNFSSKALKSPKGIRLLIYHMALAGGSKVEPDDLKRLDLTEIGKFTDFMTADVEGKGKG